MSIINYFTIFFFQSSEYEEYYDSEEEFGARLKPVFVRKWVLIVHNSLNDQWFKFYFQIDLVFHLTTHSIQMYPRFNLAAWIRSDRVTVQEREQMAIDEEKEEEKRKKLLEDRRRTSRKVPYLLKKLGIEAELRLASVIVNRFLGGSPLIQIFVTQCEYKKR